MVKTIGILLFMFCSVFLSKADYWKYPTCKNYYSADSSAYIYVVPACITITKEKKNKCLDTCSGECLKKRPCIATVYKESSRSIKSLYSFELINPYAPRQVFISNNGLYVVSIDDWGSAGTGKNVLVIYKNGKLLKKYSLSEISPIPLSDYYSTTSSIWWFDKFDFIKDSMFKISFQDKSKKRFVKYFDLEKIQ